MKQKESEEAEEEEAEEDEAEEDEAEEDEQEYHAHASLNKRHSLSRWFERNIQDAKLILVWLSFLLQNLIPLQPV